MMLAWSAGEPPNGYGVANCSSLSGNALAALVSAKAAVAVMASEATDRRVVMISRSPRLRGTRGSRKWETIEHWNAIGIPGLHSCLIFAARITFPHTSISTLIL